MCVSLELLKLIIATYSIFSLSEWFRSIFSCRALSVSWSDPQSLAALVPEQGLGRAQLLLLGELIMSMGDGDDDEEDNDRDVGCVWSSCSV